MDVSCPELIARLDRSVEAGSLDAITAMVKADLEELLARGAVALPDRFRQPRADTYARRLLHRDPAGRYTAIVMTWAPGQGTPVHDHGGLWCVEGVVEGQIAVTQYDVAPAGGRSYVVTAHETIRAGVGTAGRLIPPTDHHVIVNALADRPSLTLHVYGGDLCQCQVFTPQADGLYTSQVRGLSFHD
ncbi:MAG: cysteine dioxygenase family protein [Acidobacteria bacterium]|nr:cysteine dioxygenase family protein [Acidobacteriota bacterium]